MGKDNSKTIALLTLGCKLNYAETGTYARGFREAGLEVVPWNAGADVYLINTCSVTATADSKSRNLVRKALRQNPSALVVVVGCSAQLRRAEYEAIPGVMRVFGCGEKALVVPETLRFLDFAPCHLDQDRRSRGEISAVFPAWSSGDRTRSFLKVQDGCSNFCAYCTVPYARGTSRSVPLEECVANARQIAARGVKEIVLTGVNTGDWGRGTPLSFLDLLKALEEVEGIERYRISSIEPNLLTDEIIDWTAASAKFQPHFHMPLQTGTDAQLRRMGRRYTTGEFLERIQRVRSAFEAPGKPLVFFGIDVMVGLPGETPEDFEQTRRFLAEDVRPAFLHVFPYSRRPGTRAFDMPDQVGEDVKKERVAVLEELSERLHAEFIERNRGIHERALMESTGHDGFMEGYTGNYIRIRRPWDPELCGKIIEVTI